jgi:hypothetical protein
LLGNLVIDRPGQLFGADITCIPLRHGFLYLVAYSGVFDPLIPEV